MEYVIFNLGEEMFGIPVSQVREVVPLPVIDPIPSAPDFIEGVITLRGHSVAVMDLRKRFGLFIKKQETGNMTQDNHASCIMHHASCILPHASRRHVMVVRLKPMIMGLLVDRVHDVLEISINQIDSSANVVNGYLKGDTITGIAHVSGKVVILLDLKRVLGSQEQKEMKEICI